MENQSSINMDDIDQVANAYFQRNREVWAAFEPPASELKKEAILVDCLVTTLPYMIGNLVIAKYLQKEFGYRIHALVPEGAPEWLQYFFTSFGVEKVFHEKLNLPSGFSMDLTPILKKNNIKHLRKSILEYTIEDIVIGDLLYDSYLIGTHEPTIDGVTSELLDYFKTTHAYCSLYKDIIREGNIVTAVMGHVVYLRFGLITRLLVNAGGTVYGKKPGSGPLTVRKYTDTKHFNCYEIEMPLPLFNQFIMTSRTEELHTICAYLDSRLGGSLNEHEPESYLGLMWKGQKNIPSSELLDLLGLDPDKPTVCIFAHVFSDAPHIFSGYLYNDFYEWLTETLKIARTHTHLNWIVRSHPAEKCSFKPTKDGVVMAMKDFMDAPNIALLPEGIKSSSIMSFICGAVTVTGTSGIEMPAYGIPIVLAGRAHYAQKGFTIEPKTEHAYALALGALHLEKVKEEQIKRARLYAYCFFFMVIMHCKFVPKTNVMVGMEVSLLVLFKEALDALDDGKIESDPVYCNFMHILKHGNEQMLQFDMLVAKYDG